MMGFYRFACGAEAAPTFPPEHGAWPRRVWHKSDVGPCTACPVADIAKPEARRSGFLPGLSVSCLAIARNSYTMPFEEYRLLPAMNWSTLKWGNRSLRHMKQAIDRASDTDTTSRLLLRSNHAAVLEWERFKDDCAIFPGPVRRGKEWEAFKLEHAGKVLMNQSEFLLKQSEFDAAVAVRAAIEEHDDAARLLANAETEQVIRWTDKLTGVPCKARLDVYSPGQYVADLKGCGSVGEYAFKRDVERMLYYGQAAWYLEAVEAIIGRQLPYYLIPYETKPPHDVGVYEVDPDWLKPGREFIRRQLDAYAGAIAAEARGVPKKYAWPGACPAITFLPSPPKHINPDVEDYEVVD